VEKDFSRLPGVDKLLSDERIGRLLPEYPHELVVKTIRETLEQVRRNIAAGKVSVSQDDIVDKVVAQLRAWEKPSLRPVINASGVIIHTNLGRAPLSDEAIKATGTVSRGYSNLEFNLDNGNRGSRNVHLEDILCELSGAEAALVVNNNASAVLLALSALARRKEVIVSRGQAVEIGGGFRIPDVMRQSGAKLVEVGTTNCTYAADFEQAVTDRTVAMMRIHSSNFRLVGFTSEVTLEDMVEISRKHELMVIDDLGSGCFLDTTAYGLAPEPMVQQSIAAGVPLVCFSGDKLVGGPQAGIIVGEKRYIDKLKKHPLARAVRTDKTRLAALGATLLHYLRGEAAEKIPVWRMISADPDDIKKRAGTWASALGDMGKVIPGETMVGGGSLPGGSLPTHLVAIGGSGVKPSARTIGEKLRKREIPVIGRISEDVLLLDPRTVLPEEDEIAVEAIRSISKM
jgi:L-seryl-tRNA(Ser) seleniumtransferase